MTQVEEIEKAIVRLSPDELSRFQKWYEEFEAERWDAQIAADADSGKLDFLTNEAMDEYAQRHGQLDTLPLS